VRLYDRGFKLIVPPTKALAGSQPHRIAFSPDGSMLAVGYEAAAAVERLHGPSLAPLPRPDVAGLPYGPVPIVTWSRDGKPLYAGGGYTSEDQIGILAWADAGRGARRALPAGTNTVSGLAALPDGRLLVAAQDPFLELFDADGNVRWSHSSPKA